MEACIMVIEDNQDIRELLCDLLTDEDYAVAVYASPEAAIGDIDRVKPDLIILDWLFDRKPRGLQMLQSLRLRSGWKGIPVVICSGANRHLESMEPHLHRRGAQVVYKPFPADELLDVVRAALQPAQPLSIAIRQPYAAAAQ